MDEKSPKYTDEQRAAKRAKEARRKKRISSHDRKEPLTRENAISTMHSMAEEEDKWVVAYPCDFCPWWHVGHDKSHRQREPNPSPRTEIGLIKQYVGELFGEELRTLAEELEEEHE